MAQQFAHHVQVRSIDNQALFQMVVWCRTHIAPNHELWDCSKWDSTIDGVVFMFADKQHACEFALIWS